MVIREYLKLARSFNAVLTGISPVMGAIAMQQYDLVLLFFLFLIGFLGHTYGFVLNDILDYKIDRYESGITDRPLVSGTISMDRAWAFALSALLLALLLAIYLSLVSNNYLPLFILIISACFITLYDLISKKLPMTDLILGAGVFFLVLYGASTQVSFLYQLPLIVWIVCILGTIQVLFMNIVAGGLKDIENDFRKGANTLAVKLGVRVVHQELRISLGFKFVAYGIQLLDIIFVFLPFVIITTFINSPSLYIQCALLILIGFLMLFFSTKLLATQQFNRDTMRKYIGLHYYTNFALVPVLLMTLTPWALIIVIFPALGFILSNFILHGTWLQPKTM